jgi:hypothetical protein
MGDTMRDVEPALVRTRPDREGLYMLASEQAGHFTTAQAAEYGTSPALLSYHAASGTMPRIYPGVYRFRDFPHTPHEEIVAACLAVGGTVVSHASALDLWGLTDLIPDAIHLTVPRGRRNLPKLPGVRIHTTSRPLRDGDVWSIEALRATSPQRTLLDVATAGASPEHVIIGVRQARAKGWVDERRLRKEAEERGLRIMSMIERALSTDDGTHESIW